MTDGEIKAGRFCEHPIGGSGDITPEQRIVWVGDGTNYNSLYDCKYVVLNTLGSKLLLDNRLQKVKNITLSELVKSDGVQSIHSLEKLIKEGWSSIINGELY